MKTLIESPLLTFSQEVHRHKAARPALAKLHTVFNLNPNIILYSCWCAHSGRGRLSRKDFGLLKNSIHDWHEHIVRNFKRKPADQHDHPLPDWILAARDALEKEAQTAEQIELRLLCDALMKPVRVKRIAPQRLQDAVDNIANYCKVSAVLLTNAGCRAAQQVVIAAFPNFNPAVIEKLCYETLGRDELDRTPFQQRQLDLE